MAPTETCVEAAEERDARACEHRDRARAAVVEGETAAVVEALLALEARLDELVYYVARIT